MIRTKNVLSPQRRLGCALAAILVLCAAQQAAVALPAMHTELNDGVSRSSIVHQTQVVTMPAAGGSSQLQPSGVFTSNLGAFDLAIVPGATLAANVPALNAFNRAVNQWRNRIADPITITIEADMAPLGSGILGQTSSFVLSGSYTTLRNALVADAADEPDDAIVASLPAIGAFSLPAGFGIDGDIQVTKANAKALGFTGIDDTFGTSDAMMIFNTNYSFDFDRSDGITPDFFDFEGIAAHEIGHALGFVSDVDYVDAVLGQNGTAPDVEPTTLDLFRFADGTLNDPATVADFQIMPRSMVPGVAAMFDQINPGFGGSAEALFSTGQTQGDGRQASHWKDNLGIGVMDPTAAPQEILTIAPNDLRAFDLIGYEITQVPEAGGAALLLIGGMTVAVPQHRLNRLTHRSRPTPQAFCSCPSRWYASLGVRSACSNPPCGQKWPGISVRSHQPIASNSGLL
jgi:hypothetical protein